MTYTHIPVMPDETIAALKPAPGKLFVDGTVGLGNHSKLLLENGASVICIDKDDKAISIAKEKLSAFAGKTTFVKGDFCELKNILAKLQIPKIDGILLDLGVSSMQLDDATRGFSFRADAPLDMRMDTENPITAATIVNTVTKQELINILIDYESYAAKIADAIIRNRPMATTKQLADCVISALPAKRRHSDKHPATKTFLALRIFVNNETEAVRKILDDATDLLSLGGRLAVITFHSTEDRIVKQNFMTNATTCVCPPRLPACCCGKTPNVKILGKYKPKQQELNENPRSHSATLRVCEKI